MTVKQNVKRSLTATSSKKVVETAEYAIGGLKKMRAKTVGSKQKIVRTTSQRLEKGDSDLRNGVLENPDCEQINQVIALNQRNLKMVKNSHKPLKKTTDQSQKVLELVPYTA